MKTRIRAPSIVTAIFRLLFAAGFITSTHLTLAQTNVPLVPMGAVWKYLDTGADQGTAWIAPGFDDSGWASGPGQLGYGDVDEATVVGFGPDPNNKYITTYFRHRFVVNDAGAVTNLTVRLLVDDGAVVYLNGLEVLRANLPAGTINFRTLATSAAENAMYSATLSPRLLVNGTNVVGVEVHQNAANSSDLSFDLELIARTSAAPSNGPPAVQIVQPLEHSLFFSPASILLVARGGDSEGDLQQVEFFAGTNSLGLATRLIEDTPEIWPPELAEGFGLYWTNVPVDRYQVTARATDGAGNTTTSAPVHVAVVPETVTVVNIAATDPEAREFPPLVPGFDDATFTIQRAGNTNVDLVVRYLIGGTASNGVDYVNAVDFEPLSGSVRMAAGVTNAEVIVWPLDDTLIEGTETVILSVISPFYGPFWPPPPECYLTGPNASATAYIYDYVPPTNQPPTITSQPVSQTNYAGRTMAFEVRATGQGLDYQWFFNGTPILSERYWGGYALVLTNLEPADAGNYWVVVSNSAGSITSAVATLTVVPPAVYPGAFDPSFQARLGSELDAVFHMVAQTNGQVVISGVFSLVNGVLRAGLARLNTDGSLDTAFNPSFNADVEALAVQGDGKLLMGGAFTNVNGLRRDGLVRLLPDGTVDPGFLPNLPEYVRIHALAVQADGKILTAAELPRMADCNLMIRLFSDGSLDPGFVFSPMRGNPPTVRAIVPQPDGKILLGGDFELVYGDARRGVARLNSNGYLDYSFNPGTGAFGVSELVLLPDGRILIGGAFDAVSGVPRRGLARLMPNGSVDTNFVANTECCLSALALQSDGKILIGGGFRTVNGVTRNGVARLLPDGSVDLTFDSGSGLSPIDDSSVLAMVVEEDGRIVIGGTGFVAYDGFPCVGLARLYGDSALAAPAITQQPASQTVAEGGTATFSVTAAGTPPLCYQWQKDGANLNGQTNSVLTLVAVLPSASGQYRVIVSNASGTVSSDEAALRVLPGQLGRAVVLNEVLAHNRSLTNTDGTITAWIELRNATSEALDLTDCSLSDEAMYPRRWIFPAGAVLPPNGFLVVRCDGSSPPSTNMGAVLNTGFGLKANGDSVYLFDRTPNDGGALLDEVTFGLQVGDFALGRVPDATGSWTLCQPTLAGANVAVNLGDPAAVKINEWMSHPQGDESDWFELYNPQAQPVTLGGCFLTDSLNNPTQYCIPPYSYLGNSGSGFRVFYADHNVAAGADHTGFRLGNGGGEIGIFSATGEAIDTIAYGVQPEGISEGRLPDGGTTMVQFPGSATPGASNRLLATEPPHITRQPVSQTAVEGGTATFSVTATGTPPLNCAWWFNAPGATNTTLIAGGTSETLALQDLQLEEAGGYWVRVWNTAGSTTSSVATLTVLQTGPGSVDLSHYPRLTWEQGIVIDNSPGVDHMLRQVDGKLVIAGFFDHVNGVPQNGLARLLPSGELDLSFNAAELQRRSQIYYITALALQLDGKILVSGDFDVETWGERAIVRLNADGSVDRSFAPPLDHRQHGIRELAVQPDGKILAAGRLVWQDRALTNEIARFNADGGVDPTFALASVIDGSLSSIAVQPDGKIVLVGRFTSLTDGPPNRNIARLHADGAWDSSFTTVIQGDAAHHVTLQPDGKLLVSGSFANVCHESTCLARLNLVRLHSDGSVDPTFNVAPEYYPTGPTAVQPDGRILTTVLTACPPPLPCLWMMFLRLNTDGSLDPTFVQSRLWAQVEGIAGVDDILLEAGNRILVGGTFSGFGGVPRDGLVRLNNNATTGPPLITQQPVSQTNMVGSTVTFTVTASTLPLNYQWLFNGETLGGETNATLVIGPLRLPNAGSYSVLVANDVGSATSTEAVLTVLPRVGGPGSVDLSFTNSLDDAGNIFAIVVQADGRILVGVTFVEAERQRKISRFLPDGSPDLTFTANPLLEGDHGYVQAITLQTNGAILLGGQIASGDQVLAGLIRLDSNGNVDNSFSAAMDRFSHVRAVTVQPDGRILAAGQIAVVPHLYRNTVVRLNADGTLDTTFDAGLGVDTDCPRSMVLLPDGKILVAGVFSDFNGVPRPGLVRLHSNGSVDLTFVPSVGPLACVRALVVQADGRILAAGPLDPSPSSTNVVVRLNSDGSTDSTFVFTPAVAGRIDTLAVQADGDILVGGEFMAVNGVTRRGIVRLHADGGLDSTFDPGLGPEGDDGFVSAIALQADGKILVGGQFETFDGVSGPGIARLNGDAFAIPTITQQPLSQTNIVGSTVMFTVTVTGTPPLAYQWYFDRAMIPGETAATLTLTNVQRTSAGTYEVRVSNAAGVVDPGASLSVYAPLTGPGSVDVCFSAVLEFPDADIGPSVRDMVKQPDGKVIICGTFTTVNGVPRAGLARLLASGELDPSFNPPTADVDTIALQADGKLLIGGRAGEGLNERPLARLNPDGSVDATFAPPFESEGNSVCELIIQPDGRILAAGWLGAPGLARTNRVVRLQPEGSVDATFQSSVVTIFGGDGYVRTLAVQGDGRVLVAGRYGSINGDERHYNLARLNADGSLDTGFQTAIEGYAVHCVKALANGQLLVGGDMVEVCQIINGEMTNCTPCSNLILLNPDGTLDTTFTAAAEQMRVNVIEVQPDGKLLVGGYGHLPGNMFFDYVTARFNADGSLDQSFIRGSVLRCSGIAVNALALIDDGKMWVGGAFCNYNGIAAQGLVRLNGDQSTFSCRLSTFLCPRTGVPQVMLTGPTGTVVVIEATSDLRNWTPVMTVTNGLSGVQVCDPGANGSPQRFYRARQIE